MAMKREETEQLIQEVLEVYPEETGKQRAKHLMANDPELEKSNKCIVANKKALPGVMTARGCAYAGAKGVVWGPIKDVANISHGPVGCGQFSRAGRRNYITGFSGVNVFGDINFTSDFQEKDVVFGGDKKLTKLIAEIDTLFPLAKGVTVQSECPIGLIGDDIEAVAKSSAKTIGKVVVPVRCEGFRGVSQSLGHHVANDSLRDWVLSNRDGKGSFESTPYDVAITGDYNIGGDAWAVGSIP
jgi:nitrogenase molybdenum-iron protein alpha chain